MSLIHCEDISFSYEGKTVLSDINFKVERGDYLCIIGENGAGKSTLMKGLLSLKKPSKGKIQFEDGFYRNEIGYLPQQTQIQKDFPASVGEVVLSGRQNKLGMWPVYRKKDREMAKEWMSQLGLEKLEKHCYRELSGGQQQRVLLARALCATSSLLLLDEPVAGLDPVVTKELYQLIAELNRDKKLTVIMISHDLESALHYGTHILYLAHKQLFFGTKQEFLDSNLGKQFIAGEME